MVAEAGELVADWERWIELVGERRREGKWEDGEPSLAGVEWVCPEEREERI